MKRSSLSELEIRFGRKEAGIWPWCLGIVGGSLVPAMVLVAGWIVELLNLNRQTPFPDSIRLGQWLALPSSWIGASHSPLQGLLTLIGVWLVMALIESWTLLELYRWGVRYAVDLDVRLRNRLFETHVSQAKRLGVTGQSASWNDADLHWIPQVRDGVTAWYRSFHRYVIQAMVCFTLAVCIHPLLMLVTFIAFVLVWRLYRTFDGRRRRSQPVLSERSHSALDQLRGLAAHGPQLAAIHSPQSVQQRIDGLLRSYRDAESKFGFGFVWRTPTLAAIVALIVAMFCVVLSVHVLKPDSTLDVAAALTMLGLIALGYLAVVKVVRCCSRCKIADPAAKRLLELFSQPEPSPAPASMPSIGPIRQSFTLENVSVADAAGQKLLEGISFRVAPGSIVAILSSSSRTAAALAELIAGYGKPESGRVAWDGASIEGFNADSLMKQRVWIEPAGPIVVGTVTENVSPGDRNRPIDELVDAVREAGAYEAISELPDSFSTLLSDEDDRLKGDALFRLGVARALLSQASIVVANEPAERNGSTAGETIDALRALSKKGRIVFVQPRRSNTLRQVDQVILLHEKKVAAVGTHQELLESSELYRHLNYILFSPLRNVVIG